MTGIAPSQGPIPENLKLPTESPEGAAKEKYQGQVKGEKVTQGFDKQNSMSVAKGVDAVAIMASKRGSNKPILDKSSQQAPISKEQLKSNSQAVQRQMNTVYLTNAMHLTDGNPETFALAITNLDKISTEISQPEIEAIVHEHMNEVRKVLDDGLRDKTSSGAALTKGKLEEILQSMVDKLSDNQSVRMQNDIKAEAKLKAKLHDEILEKTKKRAEVDRREYGPRSCGEKAANDWGTNSKKHGRWKRRKKAEISALNTEIDLLKRALDNAPGFSKIFAFAGHQRPEGAKEKALDKIELLLNSRGLDLQVFSPKTEDTMDALSMEDGLAEGLVISHDSMSQAEFMRMLQQLQEINENNEKLEEAIAALQSGDPRAAAEIVKGMEGGIEGLSDENSQTLNTMIDTLLNDEPLNAKEKMQRHSDINLEHIQEVAQEAGEQQKLLGEMSPLKFVVRG